eukprot:TRINITY_DN3580_c0_g3_i1.p1 TRINITY_DN3580_c0_g3~~TRINITY_DN3580_c0_g3_i1.p1  ORF type:complete len:105 (+),score=28.48 TRINITY_DN3580_c0_g3_i1:252-566(+)
MDNFEEVAGTLTNSLRNFRDPPFTIQRLCELLLNEKLYSSTSKYTYALDKLVSVSQTQQSYDNPEEYIAEINKRKQSIQNLREDINIGASKNNEEDEDLMELDE